MQNIKEILAHLPPIPGEKDLSTICREQAQMRVDCYNATQGGTDKTSSNHRYLFDTVYDCPICKNKGLIAFLDKNGYEVMRDCTCRQKRISMMSAYKSGLGDLLDKKVNDFHALSPWQKNMKQKATAFLQQPSRGFAALGQSGSGKTHICASICNYFIAQGKSVCYFSWVADADRLKSLRIEDGAAYRTSLDRYKNTDVLYLDDLFKCRFIDRLTEKDISLAFELINHRLNTATAITVISSEWTTDQLQQIDCAVAGRLLELCKDNLIQIPPGDQYNYRLTF